MAAQLIHYPWPGNVRELRNTMENYVITGEVPTFLREAPAAAVEEGAAPPAASPPSADPALTLREAVERAEKAQIQAALKAAGGEVSQAAQRLGVHRSVLYKKIAKYQLHRQTVYGP